MEPVHIAPANSFLSLVQNSDTIDANSKNLYKRMNEIWQSMHRYLIKQDRDGRINKIFATEALTSALLTAICRRRFKMFNDWVEKTNQELATKIDFPLDMIVPIQSRYIETLDKLSSTQIDPSFFNAPLKPDEARLRDSFLECINFVTSARFTFLFSEYLTKHSILILDPNNYQNFNVNLEQAIRDQSRQGDRDVGEKLHKLLESKLVNFNELQMKYMRGINWMYNDFLSAMINRIRNISTDAQFDIQDIHTWRCQQKRKFEDEKSDLQKRLRSSEDQNVRLKAQVEDLLNKCLLITKEIDQLRAEATRKMDENALEADAVVRNHLDMSKDLYEKNKMLMAQLETLTAERNALQTQLNAKGLIGRFLG